MDISYHKGFARNLGRDMEYKRYGHAGRPVVVFPTSQGRFYQFEDSGGLLEEFKAAEIGIGRIQQPFQRMTLNLDFAFALQPHHAQRNQCHRLGDAVDGDVYPGRRALDQECR